MQWAVAFGLLCPGGCADDNAAGGSGVPGGPELWNEADPGRLLAAGRNLLTNPGFDRDLSGWTVDSGPAVISWTNDDPADCGSSGSLQIDNGSGDSSQRVWQCVPVSPATTYDFGVRLRGAGLIHCVVDLYGSGGCRGAPRKAADLSWINVYWSIDLGSPEAGASPFSSDDAVSARIACWAESPGAPKLDMAYLSPAPAG